MAESRGARRGVRAGAGDLEGLIDNFLGSRDNQRFSRHARELCRERLGLWREAMAEEGAGDIKRVRKVYLKRWMESLGEGVDTLYSVAFVRLLFGYAAQRHLLAAGRNPFESLPVQRLPESALFDDAARAALAPLDGIPDDSFENVRDRAFLRLMQVTGVWLGGLVGLDVYDPSNLSPYTILPEGVVRYRASSGQTVVAAVDATTMEWLERWMTFRETLLGPGMPGPLWVSRRGERVRRASMAPRVRKLATQYGLE